MAIEKQVINESQIGLTLSTKRLDHNNVNQKLLPSSHEIIVIDDDSNEDITLEPKEKKRRLGSWWDNVEPFDELSVVVKGLPKAKENNCVASETDSLFCWTTNLQETKTKEDEGMGDESTIKNKGYGHVTLEELGVTVEDLKSIPWEAFDPMWEIRSVAYEPWLAIGGCL